MEPHCRIGQFCATTNQSSDRKLLASLLLAAVLAAPVFPAFSAGPGPAPAKPDLVKGAATFSTVCVACHAADGNSVASINPKLAQQHPEYLVKQLQEFKSGKKLVENELGSQHNLNEVFLQAINNLIVYMTP